MFQNSFKFSFILTFLKLLGLNYAFDFYSENLLISPLPNGDLQSFFNFSIAGQQNVGNSIHVPWIFRDLFKRFSIEEFKISMAQGFWRTNIWGEQRIGTESPTGTELLVKFVEGTKKSTELWSGIVQTINGLFCTSILGIYPQFSGQPKLSSNWWYGTLGGESVCTENLKSWKKLLPCKQSGLIMLMEPTVLLSARFHSISIKISKRQMEKSSNWEFSFLAKTVHDGEMLAREFNDLSLQDLFDRKLTRKCPIANQSQIRIEKNEQFGVIRNPATINGTETDLSIFDFKNWKEEENLNIYLKNNFDHRKHFPVKGISVHSFQKSVNQIGGLICTRIANPFPTPVNAKFMHLIPWQIRIFLHTLKFICSNSPVPIKNNSFTLARDGQRPLLIELELAIPPNSNCKIEMEYEAAFLKISDFPPDANSGIHIPGAVLTIPFSTNAHLNSSHFSKQLSMVSSPMISENFDYRIFGEPLLILLPVPDFSMPFNVICLVCTTIAIYYGNTFALSTKLMKLVPKEAKKEEIGTKESFGAKIKAKIGGYFQKFGQCLPERFKKKRE